MLRHAPRRIYPRVCGGTPWNGEFDYSSAYKQVDYEALKADIEAVMTLDRFDLR